MNALERTRQSHFLALVLRHKPERIGLTLDQNGWAAVTDLCQRSSVSRESLAEIVRLDEKGRYEFDDTGERIRAVQGHSIEVDAEPEPAEPPEYLYHGTQQRSLPQILEQGLKPMNRLYVHLSPDEATARTVGRRRGKEVAILRISAAAAAVNGVKFWRARNGVYLSEWISPEYVLPVE